MVNLNSSRWKWGTIEGYSYRIEGYSYRLVDQYANQVVARIHTDTLPPGHYRANVIKDKRTKTKFFEELYRARAWCEDQVKEMYEYDAGIFLPFSVRTDLEFL